MDRRAFLRRMAVTLGAIAVAPAAAAQLLDRPREFAIPLDVTKGYGAACLPDSGYESVCYDEWPTGIMDYMQSTSLHSISTHTAHEWNGRVSLLKSLHQSDAAPWAGTDDVVAYVTARRRAVRV